MIVVADTTPINYLILIGEIEVLAKLYGRVVIPETVRSELTQAGAPARVREWIAHPPGWLEVLSPSMVPDADLERLDAGERDALALAVEHSADQVIVDELLGRREAERRGLSVIGTIGVLREAAYEGLLDLRIAVERLRQTSFHISPAILASLLDEQR
jgi:predicted nucleic acid-binding protein